MKKSSPHNGNALLIAMLLTSILILITVGLSRLVASETRQIGELIRNNRAEYLAEGGTELGQLIFKNTESNFEMRDNQVIDLSPDIEDNIEQTISFALYTTTNHLPIIEPELFIAVDNSIAQADSKFTTLPVGESIEIPLNSTKFEVQYYLPNLNQQGSFTHNDIDVLLFKISGVPDINQPNKIDFLTEYFPAGSPFDPRTTNPNPCAPNRGLTATYPAVLGTVSNCEAGFNTGIEFEYSDDQTPDVEALLGAVDQPPETTPPNYQLISSFLDRHENNILVLTNAINLDLVTPGDGDVPLEKFGTIYYRVCTSSCTEVDDNQESYPTGSEEGGLVAPFVTIHSSGIFQTTKKNLITEINRQNALPVFDFALYRTDISIPTSTDE